MVEEQKHIPGKNNVIIKIALKEYIKILQIRIITPNMVDFLQKKVSIGLQKKIKHNTYLRSAWLMTPVRL